MKHLLKKIGAVQTVDLMFFSTESFSSPDLIGAQKNKRMSPKFNTTSQKTVVITTIRDRMKATQFDCFYFSYVGNEKKRRSEGILF